MGTADQLTKVDRLTKAERMHADRLQFLKAYYDLATAASETGSDSLPVPSIKFWSVGEQLAFDENRTSKIAHQLSRDELLKAVGIGGLYAITPKGIAYVEAASCKTFDTGS